MPRTAGATARFSHFHQDAEIQSGNISSPSLLSGVNKTQRSLCVRHPCLFVCLSVFLKQLDSAGLCAEGGDTRALHLQPLTPTPALAAGKSVVFFFNEILLLACITEVLRQVVPRILIPQRLLKAVVYE